MNSYELVKLQNERTEAARRKRDERTREFLNQVKAEVEKLRAAGYRTPVLAWSAGKRA